MKKRSLLLSVVAAFGFTTATMAQVPSYVPTNGLVGWWPFNGNANDESGNGNSGTVNGAALTADRYGNTARAYYFNGVNYCNISVPNNPDSSLNLTEDLTISSWFNSNLMNNNNGTVRSIVMKSGDGVGTPNGYAYGVWAGTPNSTPSLGIINFQATPNNNDLSYPSGSSGNVNINEWYNYVVTYTKNDSTLKYYLNGSLVDTKVIYFSIGNNNNDLWFGSQPSLYTTTKTFDGVLDDIGIWNRALTECEVADLYNAQLGSFSNSSVSINPTSSTIGSNATLTVSTPIQSLQWQSNPGNMGWNNIVNNNTYNGSTNDTLVVSNVQLSNHNQPFRVLACGDTSNIATIQIADTCVTTIYDTLLTTVTDTLIINTTLSLPAPNNENTILIYPNPASDHITIDNGNYSAMTGYSIKITNNAGQEVFLNAINQQQFYVDLSTWTGNGLYFVHLIDSQNNNVAVRKIVLQ